jgi:heptosyltransferase-2
MNVALFCPNWVGDAVMATPALTALRRRFADARLIGILRPYVADVFTGGDWFDELLPFSPAAFRGVARVTFALRRRKIDLAVLFTNSFRSALTAYLGGCREIIGFARDARARLLTKRLEPARDKDGTFKPSPMIDSYNELARAAGAADPGHVMRLFTADRDEAACDRVWQKFRLRDIDRMVVFNPGAAFGAAKLWPAEYFARLAQRLVDELQARVLVLCGPSERELARSIARTAQRRTVYSLADEPVSLGLLKAAVKRADLMVTTDSGPRHFAAAFNRPVITLFGPTHIAWTETYHPLAWHLQRQVPCGPCQQRTCPEGHHRCMRDLGPDEVFRAAYELLVRATGEVSAQRRRALPLWAWWDGRQQERKGA